jgi:hypothetical protein
MRLIGYRASGKSRDETFCWRLAASLGVTAIGGQVLRDAGGFDLVTQESSGANKRLAGAVDLVSMIGGLARSVAVCVKEGLIVPPHNPGKRTGRVF